jgi:hypothetical protein
MLGCRGIESFSVDDYRTRYRFLTSNTPPISGRLSIKEQYLLLIYRSATTWVFVYAATAFLGKFECNNL